tara:strand:+ start:3388 stop:4056 length:669 start_codon:yes stop_codon:yes gene_type:complete
MQTLSLTDSIEHMKDVLVEDGVFRINNHINDSSLDELHDDILQKCSTEAGHYEFGRNYRGENLSTYDSFSIINRVYNVEWMRKLHDLYTGRPQTYGMNVFATHDYKFTGELARNGWLHFDRHWRLKFFLYLTDIDVRSGAFSCSVGSRFAGETLRLKAWEQPAYEDVKNRIELDYPELIGNYPAEPVEGKAGTLIVFDTDTFHKGGKCDEGKERLIVRLHCG